MSNRSKILTTIFLVWIAISAVGIVVGILTESALIAVLFAIIGAPIGLLTANFMFREETL